jgi:outer membrane lipoprotein-sorting protein
MRRFHLAWAMIGLVMAGTHARAETGSAIVERMKAVTESVLDKTMRVTMRLEESSGGVRVKSLNGFEKKTPEGRKILWIFETPLELAGTAILAWQRREQPDLVWMYSPTQRRVRQISPQVSHDQGSQFTYEDLMIFSFDFQGTHRLEGEEPCTGTTCYLVETRLEGGAFTYDRLLSRIRADTFLPDRVEFFGADVHKVMEIRRLESVQGIPTILELEVQSAGGSLRTTVECEDVAYNTGLKDELFTVGHLSELGR